MKTTTWILSVFIRHQTIILAAAAVAPIYVTLSGRESETCVLSLIRDKRFFSFFHFSFNCLVRVRVLSSSTAPHLATTQRKLIRLEDERIVNGISNDDVGFYLLMTNSLLFFSFDFSRVPFLSSFCSSLWVVFSTFFFFAFHCTEPKNERGNSREILPKLQSHSQYFNMHRIQPH